MAILISDALKEYFSSLIQHLETQDAINEMCMKFEEVVNRLENNRIKEQDKKNQILESDLAVRGNVIERLIVSSDNNEQYSRRSCLQINGVELQGKEDGTEVMDKIKNVILKLVLDENIIDCAHTVAKPYTNDQGKKVQSIIVKYRNWNDRTIFYRKRPRNFNNGVRITLKMSISFVTTSMIQ